MINLNVTRQITLYSLPSSIHQALEPVAESRQARATRFAFVSRPDVSFVASFLSSLQLAHCYRFSFLDVFASGAHSKEEEEAGDA